MSWTRQALRVKRLPNRASRCRPLHSPDPATPQVNGQTIGDAPMLISQASYRAKGGNVRRRMIL